MPDSHLQSDFPIDWNEDQYVSRREFFKFLTLSSGGLAAASAGLAVWSEVPRGRRSFEPVLIAREGELSVGGWKQFFYPRPVDSCILIQRSPGVYTAYSRRCTHLSCPVVWQPEPGRLFCPCHDGAFSIDDGHVLQGPPARPLDRIELAIEDGAIYATGVASAGAQS